MTAASETRPSPPPASHSAARADDGAGVRDVGAARAAEVPDVAGTAAPGAPGTRTRHSG